MKQRNAMVKSRNFREIVGDKLPSINLRFEPRDMWIGVYWDRPYWGMDIYICIVPMLPIRLRWFYHDQLPF